jgi:hypothetical protein
MVDLGGTYYNTNTPVKALETLLRKLPDPTTPAPPPSIGAGYVANTRADTGSEWRNSAVASATPGGDSPTTGSSSPAQPASR